MTAITYECPNCHWHSGHAEDCPSWYERPINEHHDTPAAPERGDDIAQRAIAYLVCDGIVNCDKYYPPEIATWARDLMVNEQRVGITLIREAIEQHSTLIAQRERLLEGLRLAVDWMQGKRGGPSEGLLAAQVIKRLESVITTSEQEGRRER